MIYESFKQKEIKKEFQKVDDPRYFSNENEMINYIYKENEGN